MMADQMDFKGDGKSPTLCDHAAVLHMLGTYRNKIAHGARLNVYDRERVCKMLMPAMRELFEAMSFLADYRLIYSARSSSARPPIGAPRDTTISTPTCRVHVQRVGRAGGARPGRARPGELYLLAKATRSRRSAACTPSSSSAAAEVQRRSGLRAEHQPREHAHLPELSMLAPVQPERIPGRHRGHRRRVTHVRRGVCRLPVRPAAYRPSRRRRSPRHRPPRPCR